MSLTSFIILGLSLSTVGKVLLGIAVIRVHGHVIREHKIDMDVLSAMRRERHIGLFAILLILTGFVIEVLFYLGLN